MMTNGRHAAVGDVAKNFAAAFGSRTLFAAEDEAAGLAVADGLSFAFLEAPPKHESGNSNFPPLLNPLKCPLEARRRYLATYNTLALVMAAVVLCMLYQDFGNHRVRNVL